MTQPAPTRMLAATQKIVASVVVVLAVLAAERARGQQPPPNYSYDSLPETSFSCAGRQVGGYYADVEAGCQMFHVCGASQGTSFRFLCPNDTVFDQQHLVCADWFQVICDHSAVRYSRNFEIFKTNVGQEVEFSEINADNLPSLDDYDYDFQESSNSIGGAGRFFGSPAGRGRSLFDSATRAPRPVARARVTPPPVTSPPVSSFASATRRPVTSPPETQRPAFPATARPVTARPFTAPPVTAPPATARPATAPPVAAQPVNGRPVAALPSNRESTRPSNGRPVTVGSANGRLATAGSVNGRLATTGSVNGRPVAAGSANGRLATAGSVNGRLATIGSVNGRTATAGSANGKLGSGSVNGRLATTGSANGRPATGSVNSRTVTTGSANGRTATGSANGRLATTGSVNGRTATAGSANGRLAAETANGTPATAGPVNGRPVTAGTVNSRPVTARPVTARPVTRQPATARPASFQPVTQRSSPFRPVSRTRVTPAPQTFDQTTAATTPRPTIANQPGSFRGSSSTFATKTKQDSQPVSALDIPTLPPFVPTPLSFFRPTRLPPVRPTPAAIGLFSSPRPRPQSSRTRGPPRVTLGEFRSTTPSPFQATQPPVSRAPVTTTFTTPKPVFTTTGVFPFGFTSVPRQNFQFSNSNGGFSFGTAVRNPTNNNVRQSSTAASFNQQNTNTQEAEGPAPTGTTDFTQSNEVSVAGSTSSGSRRFRPRTRPAAPGSQNAVAVSPASPFFSQTPTASPTEPTRTVNPVAGRFFGSNVIPDTTPAEVGTTPAPFRPRGRGGSGSFRLGNSGANAIDETVEGAAVTTAGPEDGFSATIPTRSPSTRLSSQSTDAPTTARPRASGRRGGRRRRPSSSTNVVATTSRRRGGRRRGGARRQQIAATTAQPFTVTIEDSVGENEILGTEAIDTASNAIDGSVSSPAELAGDGESAASVGLDATSATASISNGRVRQSSRTSTRRGGSRFTAPRNRIRVTASQDAQNLASRTSARAIGDTPDEINAVIVTRRPVIRNRGSRRFNPKLPGGQLNPGKFIRTGSRNSIGVSSASRVDLSRGGLARPRQPISPPIRAEFQQELAALTDELGLNEDELELTDEELQLIEEELNAIEEEAEQDSLQGADANSRSVDDTASRGRNRFAPRRRPTASPVIQRVTLPPRPVTTTTTTTTSTTPAPESTTPLVIRKRIRIRGRPSRRPGINGLRRRTTTTTEAPTTTSAPTDASTLPTNKEASNQGRQNGFFLRPKLQLSSQLSSALPTDIQTRRLNDVNSLASERTGRSRNTSPIAFNRVVRSTTASPQTTDARLSDILFASTSPGERAAQADDKDADYDYEYYDTDFRNDHSQDLEKSESLFQALSRNAQSAREES